jgi:hypothetical protein
MPLQRVVLAAMAGTVLMLQGPCGWTQQGPKQPPDLAAQGQALGEPKSLKERLSDKASDEQRVDNCKVPLERRGPKKRPGCEYPGGAPAQLSR